MFVPTREDPSTSSTHAECGASKRTLTIAPDSVRLSLADGTSVELQGKTWEYGFRSDDPLELRFASSGSCVCTVNHVIVAAVDRDGPHWVCKRPEGADETFELSFRFEDTASQGMSGPIDKPSAAQPTLIIRTKRNCPIGVTKPTIDE
jgi:hypothetical protein